MARFIIPVVAYAKVFCMLKGMLNLPNWRISNPVCIAKFCCRGRGYLLRCFGSAGTDIGGSFFYGTTPQSGSANCAQKCLQRVHRRDGVYFGDLG